jgi:Holliday junction resolvasome RuvABC ATP-dependent DNA helicase subunit
MRTTVDIEDPVMKELRAIQKREGKTLGALVSRLLAQAIAQRRRGSPRPRLAWISRKMRPLLDLADKEAVYAALEEGSRPERP